jgi:sugar/nucleoside kinase (ribokinase family)
VIVCALGDVTLDVVVAPADEPARGDDTAARTAVGVGGQAANVASWAASLGATARVICRRGSDAAGRLCADELAAAGVTLLGPADGRTGVVVSLVSPAGERTMLSDRGSAPELAAADLEPAWLKGCDALHVSGYALLREPAAGAAAHAAELARAAGAQVSVDLSSWSAIAGSAEFGARLTALEPDLVFATEREREALGFELPSRWVVKRGAEGIVVDGRAYPAPRADVVDTTGAGDALAAGFLVAGPELGLEAAARCVARLGSRP